MSRQQNSTENRHSHCCGHLRFTFAFKWKGNEQGGGRIKYTANRKKPEFKRQTKEEDDEGAGKAQSGARRKIVKKLRDKKPRTTNAARERKRQERTFLTRASVDVLVTKYECITLYGWIPLATLKLFKCIQPWSLISGWQERRQCDRTSTTSSSSSSFSSIPNVRGSRRQTSSVSPSSADATCTTTPTTTTTIFRRQLRGKYSSLLALAGACVSLTWKESGP